VTVRPAAIIGVAALAAAVLAAATYSAPSARPVEVNCNQASAVFLFWPRGHGTIRSAHLPAHPRPHVEIYKSHSYSSSNLLGFLSSNGTVRFSSRCERSSDPAPSGPIPRNDTATRKRAITCTLGTHSLLRVTHVSGGLKLDLGIQDNEQAMARITKKGASFTYDTQFCRTGASPR
jgi:hypothetical protein